MQIAVGCHLRTPDQGGNDQENSAEESHAPLPGGDDIPRLLDIVGEQVGLLDDEIETTTYESGDDTPP